MSLFWRSGQESRAITRAGVPWSGGGDLAGANMTSALRLIPVFSAVRLIADSIATLPVHAYREVSGIGQRLPKQPTLIQSPGVGEMTRVTWLYQAITSLLLRGNAFGLVTALERDGWPRNVVWLHPDEVTVDESGPLPRYLYRGKAIDTAGLIHIPAFVLPGSVVGLSPIGLFRMQIETGLQAHKFAQDWYRTGVAPSGKLRNNARVLNPGEATTIKERFKAAVKNRDLFVTGNDWEYEALSISAADSQFLETIKATATQTAAIFGVPPEEIGGEAGGSLTYSTLEQNGVRYNTRTVLPWTTRFEESLTQQLPGGQYVRFNLDAAARADLMTRMNAYQVALVNGVMTLDEVRALEEKAPLTEAEREQWQAMYGTRGNVQPPSPTPTPAQPAEGGKK